MNKLNEIIARIKPIDKVIYKKVQARLDNLTKPQGSLGRLEYLAKRYVAITDRENPEIRKKMIYTFAGDHGVAEEGVSLFPKEVTPQMVLNFLKGGAGVNVLARHVGAEVCVVDIGVDYDFGVSYSLINKKIARGTKNIAKGPAMTREEAIASINVGIDLAEEAAREGVDIIGTGDMGIANTTPSSAIAAIITKEPARDVVGRGTGIDDKILSHKIDVVERAININSPDIGDPIDILSKVGGFEIGGIAGIILGAAANRIPVLMDGFISTAGGLIASELSPDVSEYIIASHKSKEAGHQIMLRKMGITPILDLDLRLGEGTGACLGINLLEAGIKILTEMATFDDAGVSESIM
ncbi:MAG: nicotinate-nucleotide--dimethylbenzimidazole phosphoribosyltransferase [Nitrospirota bacterium]